MTARRHLVLLLLVLVAAAPTVHAAQAGSADPIPTAPVLTRIDRGDENKVRLAPYRFEPVRVRRGDVARFALTVKNTTDETVEIEPYALTFEGSSRPESFAQPAGEASGEDDVSGWVSFPGFETKRALEPATQLRFPVIVRVPDSARPGSHAVGFIVSQEVSARGVENPDAPATRVRVQLDLASIAVLRVAGNAVSQARIRSLEAPRFVWGGEPRFSVRVENTGETDLLLDGQVELNPFLGSAGRTLEAAGPAKGYPTLPGGTRELRMRWSDPPLLGWFDPELVVVGGKGSGVRITDDLATVWVLPPWWMVVLLLVALLLPLRARRRRRRDPVRAEAERERARERVEERMRREEAKRRAAAARRRP